MSCRPASRARARSSGCPSSARALFRVLEKLDHLLQLALRLERARHVRKGGALDARVARVALGDRADSARHVRIDDRADEHVEHLVERLLELHVAALELHQLAVLEVHDRLVVGEALTRRALEQRELPLLLLGLLGRRAARRPQVRGGPRERDHDEAEGRPPHFRDWEPSRSSCKLAGVNERPPGRVLVGRPP